MVQRRRSLPSAHREPAQERCLAADGTAPEEIGCMIGIDCLFGAAQQKDAVVCCIALTGTRRLQWKFTLEGIYEGNTPTTNVGRRDGGNTMMR